MAIKNRINGELANNYGNLIQRILSFICKNLEQNIDLTKDNFNFEILKQINDLKKNCLNIWKITNMTNTLKNYSYL